VTEPSSIKSLKALRTAEEACTRCPLYKDASQVVPGEGPARARLMVVGEQPGDQEDKQGRPFVGPAGGILAKALADAGIDHKAVFVTNAVKHFKFEPRGKRRLHKRPNARSIVTIGGSISNAKSLTRISWLLWGQPRSEASPAAHFPSTRFADVCCLCLAAGKWLRPFTRRTFSASKTKVINARNIGSLSPI
jgi:Uracil DNA glycosylase superfamily